MDWIVENVEVGGRVITTRRLRVAEQPEPNADADYADMTKAELISLAEDRSVEVSSRMTKAKIIEALEGED
jgi:hypothetical protein|tara:strand:+ start:82 stop:294 length:213 start_codon:yes stop_codon:yes gene_type:complete